MNAIEMRGVAKSFGSVAACRAIDLSVSQASIHAIVGENGAGKSTAMKILYGMIAPDAGEIRLDGKSIRCKSSRDAIRAGIGMVHQHFMLAAPYTVLENIVLGDEPAFLGWIDRKEAVRKLDELSKRYGFSLDWQARVSELSVGIRQRIEIIKLLYRGADILILDEPTAVLTPGEALEFFAQLRKLREEGKTVLIITHKLKEVLALADEVTIFRQGEVVGTRQIAQTDADELATLMVGRKLARNPYRPASSLGAPVLEIQNVSLALGGHSRLADISLEVRAGEIVGIAGVEGNGQSELLRLLARPDEFAKADLRGQVRVLGQDVRAHSMSAADVRKLGVGSIPEDRHHEGLLLEQPMIESFLLGQQRDRPWSRHGVLSRDRIRSRYAEVAEEYDIRPRDPQLAAKSFSGGNQQKVIIARELAARNGHAPRLLIAAQPTRGVDVGAIEMIHGRLLRARDEGAGVLLVSSELDEVLELSDRILVLFDGRIAASFSRGDGFSESAIGRCMAGAGGAP